MMMNLELLLQHDRLKMRKLLLHLSKIFLQKYQVLVHFWE